LDVYQNGSKQKQSHSICDISIKKPQNDENQNIKSSAVDQPKNHQFDYYSYYNNKYNQENQRKKSARSVSISTASSLVQQLRLHRGFKQGNGECSSHSPSRNGDRQNSEYYITNSAHFNMKKFASSFAKDIKSKASNLLRRRHTDASISDKSLLPSREEYSNWSKSFENLLRHKYGIALFRGFLKTEFSDENIEFWIECEDYKYQNKELKREAKAKKIYSDFVAIGSCREVNLDIEIRAHTAQKILNPSFDTFDRAQKRITALMEKDSYPRFLESDLYRNLISQPNGGAPSQPSLTSRNSLTSNNSFNESLPSTSNKSLSTK
jgi:regulator of G-protein signaling